MGIVRRWAAVGVAMALATPALAAGHKTVLPEAARTAPGGRAVEIVVAQAEMSSNINPSMVDVAMGGGLLGVVIDAKIDSDREKAAQGTITPIRAALADFDADQLAIDTTQAAVSKLDWFQAAAPPDFARDPTIRGEAAELAASSAGQVVFFSYVYDTSTDFSAIRVSVTITIADKGAASGDNLEGRLSGHNLLYAQTVTSVVRLDNPGSAAENAARWAANDGALSKRALTTAFGEVGVLIPRALTLTEDDLKRMAQGRRKSIGSYGGWVQEEGPDGTLFFNGGLMHVQTIQA